MAKITTKAVFKTYTPDQPQLLPQSLDELIPKEHLVRVVGHVVDKMDLSAIINAYRGGGSSAYHPVMMIKVMLYAYAMKIYTGRKIARALRQDITFIWLAAFNKPDFRTLNEFRSGVLKQTIEELFKSMLTFLVENQYVKFENYFADGSPYAADANAHKMVWKKKSERYKKTAQKKCEALFQEIDSMNEQENREYGNQDLEETGIQASDITPQKISEQINGLNTIIEKTVGNKKKKRRATTLKKQLETQNQKLCTYEQQLTIAGERSGYSKTDTDAVAMRMKNEETLPAYNVLIGTENQFVVNYSIHQNGSDHACFKQHLEQLEKHTDKKPENINADAGFGSEENYELLEQKQIGNYVKYSTFHQEQTRKYKNNRFHKDHFIYESATDTYRCPNNRKLIFQYMSKRTHARTHYVSMVRRYQCENCRQCPFASQCKRSEEKNRTITVNGHYEQLKQQASNNLLSEKGIGLRKQRGQDVESVFGDLKMNGHFRRFHLRGKHKVKAEFGILALSHNVRKIHLQELKKVS
jgi:transposase